MIQNNNDKELLTEELISNSLFSLRYYIASELQDIDNFLLDYASTLNLNNKEDIKLLRTICKWHREQQLLFYHSKNIMNKIAPNKIDGIKITREVGRGNKWKSLLKEAGVWI